MRSRGIILLVIISFILSYNTYGYIPHESELGNQPALGEPGLGYDYGVMGHCMATDGNDYVVVNNDPSLRPNNAVTASAWVKLNTLGGPVLHKSNWNDYIIWHDGTGYTGHVKVAGVAVNVKNPIASPVGQWDHVAITYDGSAVKLFVNGKEVDSEPASGTITYGGSRPQFQIGRYTGGAGGNWWMNGKVDDVQVFERDLVGSEVDQMYQMGLRDLPSGIDPTGRVLHIDFDGDVNDRSGTGNDGNLVVQ